MDDRRSISIDGHIAEGGFTPRTEARYNGLRMSATEFETLPDDGAKYELIDGVVVMSPSASFRHQSIAGEIGRQIANYLGKHPIGEVVQEVDVILDAIRVYRPDLVFVRTERLPPPDERIHSIPDMVLEVLSPGTQARDLGTKRDDYERFGINEYWIVDPMSRKLTFLRLTTGRAGKAAYKPVPVKGSIFASTAIAGFKLDIAAVKKLMRG
ncbi:MAG TPA: Uma2 family endonuclease [Phycisphaerales bacterium]|nr:Uma2 family endonuclease [Phycisphaerales bacterium]